MRKLIAAIILFLPVLAYGQQPSPFVGYLPPALLPLCNAFGTGPLNCAQGTDSRFATVIRFPGNGVVADGVTDDTTAANAALATLTNGGVAILSQGSSMLIHSGNLTVPANVSVRGEGSPMQAKSTITAAVPASIIINPSFTVNLSGFGSALEHIAVKREGLTYSPTAAQASAAVAQWGTESSTLVTVPQSGGRGLINDVFLLGSNTCIALQSGNETINRVRGDCYNGLDVTAVGDQYTVSDVYFEPYYSLGIASVFTTTAASRPGVGVRLHETGSGGIFDKVFTFMYLQGFQASQSGSFQMTNSFFEWHASDTGGVYTAATGIRLLNSATMQSVNNQCSAFTTCLSDEQGSALKVVGMVASHPTVAGFYLQGTSATPTLVVYQGTPGAGDTGSVTLTSASLTGSPETFTYTASAGDTTNIVASNLCHQVNIDNNASNAHISCGVAGNVISIHWPTTISVTVTDAATGGITAGVGSKVATISGGTPSPGDTVSLIFTDSSLTGSPVTETYTVQIGDSQTAVATGLTAVVNADSTLSGFGISATSSTTQITLTAPSTTAITRDNSGSTLINVTGSVISGARGNITASDTAGTVAPNPHYSIGPGVARININSPFLATGNLPSGWLSVDSTVVNQVFLSGINWSQPVTGDLSSCGSGISAPFASGSTDANFVVTTGSSATGCVFTFHTPYPWSPHCTLQSLSGPSVASWTTSATVLNVTFSGTGKSTFMGQCATAGPTNGDNYSIPTTSGTQTQLTVGLGATPTVTSGGTTNVNGDVLTLNDGCTTHSQLTVTNAIAGVIQAGGVSVLTAGSCNSPPINPVAVSSSTGTDTTATFTVGAGNWSGLYTIAQPRFRVCIVGGGGGAGGVSNVNNAAAASGSAGSYACFQYTNQTVGNPLSYHFGIPGAGGAAGNNNGATGGSTAFATMSVPGGVKGNGSASGNAAATNVNNVNAGIPSQAPGANVNLISSWVSLAPSGNAVPFAGMTSPWGAGGTAVGTNTNGNNGAACGGGGGAPTWVTTGSAGGYSGGNGGGGCAIVFTD